MVDKLDVGVFTLYQDQLRYTEDHGRTAMARMIHAMHLERSYISVPPNLVKITCPFHKQDPA